MIDAIVHRGPDGKGTLLFDHACLGHVRLSVIDLAGGGQPMSTPDGKLHISYNGELYNFRELKKELESNGVRFQSNSDTEVVLLAYRQYGIDAFNRFRGMFALALWDSQRQEGLLVRDRFGIKPLFYANFNDQMIFASEIKAINKALPNQPEMNLRGLHLLMNFRYIPGDQTLFTDVFHLPPGHCLKWENGNFRIIKWEEKPKNAIHNICDIEHIRDTLVSAVKKQLVSDVPLGAYLSSGMDSSTILALSIKNKGLSAENFPTFTIQTGDSRFEAQQAGETANFFGVPNHQEPLNIDLDNILPRLIWHLEVPKVNALQSAMVARLAGKYVKVALSGLGGDEIFLGYNIHRILALLESSSTGLKRGSAYLLGHAGQTIFGLMGLRFEELKRGCQALRMLPDFASIYGIIRNVWDSPVNRKRIYGPRMQAENFENAATVLKMNWPDNNDPVTAAAVYELKQKMVNDLLLQEDRLSMAFGLEVRVPFLDEDLVRLLSSVDRRRKMPGAKLKSLMREVVSEWLPREIINRPKSGFQVPIHQFFNSHLRPFCHKYLSRKRLEKDGLFNPDFVESILKARPHKSLRWHYFMLYLMLGANIWLDIFEQGKEIPKWN